MDRAAIERMSAAADAFARTLAGEDHRRYMQLFLAAVNLADTMERDDGNDGGAEMARVVAGQRGGVLLEGGLRTGGGPDAHRSGLHDNPSWIANSLLIIADDTRIIGGAPTLDFPDCIAIGSEDRWCCTGTLVAPNVIVTAGHCVARGCSTRVFVGPDVNKTMEGEVIAVTSASVHPGYQPPQVNTNDVAVLILAKDVTGVPPRSIAPPGVVEVATSVVVVGYGHTDIAGSTGYGIRRRVDVPLVSNSELVGQDPTIEFVAGRPFLERDSCSGDSGGPVYIDLNGSWFLVGVTSRGVPGRRTCGDGGIYSTVAEFEDWIRAVPGGRW
jgi:Trypsin